MSLTRDAVLDRLVPIGLAEANDVAELQTRVDRKYIVDHATLVAFVQALGPASRVLSVGGSPSCDYRSTYFDTPELALYRAAVQGRRQRCKVRSRRYGDSGPCFFEVKTKGRRGTNVKARIDHHPDRSDQVSDAGRSLVAELSGDAAIAASLVAVLDTTYSRSTVIDPPTASRLTIDSGLRCTGSDGRSVLLDGYVIETKSASAPSGADRWLWRHGVRPTKLSKFGTGLGALRPDLPSNKWHRVIKNHWHVAEQRFDAECCDAAR